MKLFIKRFQIGGATLAQNYLVGAATVLDVGGVTAPCVNLGSQADDLAALKQDVHTVANDFREVVNRGLLGARVAS